MGRVWVPCEGAVQWSVHWQVRVRPRMTLPPAAISSSETWRVIKYARVDGSSGGWRFEYQFLPGGSFGGAAVPRASPCTLPLCSLITFVTWFNTFTQFCTFLLVYLHNSPLACLLSLNSMRQRGTTIARTPLALAGPLSWGGNRTAHVAGQSLHRVPREVHPPPQATTTKGVGIVVVAVEHTARATW